MNKTNLAVKHAKQVHYKAGDFTSGKMGDIFKTCYLSLDLSVINHKQFGESNLIPVEYIEFLITCALRKNCLFNEFLDSERHMSFDDFSSFKSDTKFEIVNDFLCDGFTSWFDVMTGLFLVWGDCSHDQDLQNTKTNI